MRVFYVLFVADPHLRTALDAIRFLYDPLTRHSAHVTVRGPYRQRINASRLSSSIEQTTVTLYDVSHFFEERGQHTVFFDVAAEGLDRVWSKPDYAFDPHLTLYDGRSRRDALELYQIAKRFRIAIQFQARGLEPLISNGKQANFSLVDSIDFDFLSSVTRSTISAATLADPGKRRPMFAERLCQYLASQTPSSGLPTALARGTQRHQLGLPAGWAVDPRPRSWQLERPSVTPTPRVKDAVDSAWKDWEFLHRPTGEPRRRR
jgi:hypothetical protein